MSKSANAASMAGSLIVAIVVVVTGAICRESRREDAHREANEVYQRLAARQYAVAATQIAAPSVPPPPQTDPPTGKAVWWCAFYPNRPLFAGTCDVSRNDCQSNADDPVAGKGFCRWQTTAYCIDVVSRGLQDRHALVTQQICISRADGCPSITQQLRALYEKTAASQGMELVGVSGCDPSDKPKGLGDATPLVPIKEKAH